MHIQIEKAGQINKEERIKMSEAPSFTYEIRVARLNGQDLPDGDQIKLEYVGLTVNPSEIEFELVLQKGMWWKGLVLFEQYKSNAWQEVVAGDYNDLQKPGYAKRDVSISYQDFTDKFSCLSKAKGAGVHTNIYHIADAASTLARGSKYRITWFKD